MNPSTPQRPANGQDVVYFVKQLVNPRPSEAHGSCQLPNAGNRAVNTQAIFCQGNNLFRGIDADLLQQWIDEILEYFLLLRHAGLLQRLTDPLFDVVYQFGDYPYD